jgi:hypothetical protein
MPRGSESLRDAGEKLRNTVTLVYLVRPTVSASAKFYPGRYSDVSARFDHGRFVHE